MKLYKQQAEPGTCINCDGVGVVDRETWFGDGEEYDIEECGVCDGSGVLTAGQIEALGWATE